MESKHHERIEVTCTTCGRSLKAKKKYAGQSLRCPKCKAMNMVPFGHVEGIHKLDTGLAAAEAALSKVTGDPGGPSAGPSNGPALVGSVSKNIPEIDNLLRSMYKCFEDEFARAQNVLFDVALNAEKKEAELVRVRRDMMGGTREHVLKTQKEIEDRVEKLRTHPMAKSVNVKTQLEEAIQHQSAFQLFAKCVFDIKPKADGAPPKGK